MRKRDIQRWKTVFISRRLKGFFWQDSRFDFLVDIFGEVFEKENMDTELSSCLV